MGNRLRLTAILIAAMAALTALPARLHAETITGTAFFVTADGYALTCAHVIKDATQIELLIRGKSIKAAIIATDEKNDIALLKAEVMNQSTIRISSTGKAEAGAKVWVLGFPLASVLGDTVKVTSGAISGISIQGTQRMIQIDAAVNPGNSGGPLLNDRGVVVGIVNAKIVGSDVSGVGFAIPTSYAMQLLRDAGASLPNATGGTVLDGPTLAKRANPAVALVRATVPLKEPVLVKSLPVGNCLSVSFSPDGKTLICAGGDTNKATIWDVTTGKLLQSFTGITRDDFKPGDLQAATKGFIDNSRVWSAAFSPDGRLVMCDSSPMLMLCDVGTGRRVDRLFGGVFGTLFTFSADGQRLLYGAGIDGDIQCRDMKTNEESPLGTKGCSGISVSPNGKLVAVGYGGYGSDTTAPHVKGTIEILELPKGKLVRRLAGSRACVDAVAYSPDGRWIAGSETDARPEIRTVDDATEITPGVVTIWDSESGGIVRTLQCPGMSPSYLKYSPDGKLLAVELKEAKRYSGATMVSSVWLYDPVSGERIAVMAGSLGTTDCHHVFSPDCKFLALCGNDQTAKIWQVK